MQLKIKNQAASSQSVLTIDVLPTDSVATLKEKLVQSAPDLSSLSLMLIYEGKKLESGATFEALNMPDNATINLVPSTPKKSKKSKCMFGDCTDRVATIIGNCSYCKSSFCGKHRLPEAHACTNLQTCRQAAFDRNSVKLMNEKTVATKI
eukprot:NODE_945_length_1103_cov_81.334016_g901_i0.p2 GENE.NODE_945_length_1103_cov_81.334016_g901_i0~~NODE_945_length_1103_cov_81.334016_g901_i0.p2  ORF type:complete len:150 (-),score=32.19 NODE_945_length_1103_cov_81.334016_g901_i0:199-648(-)